MKLLIDADFFVALVKEDDANHQTALRKTNELHDAALFVTPFGIPETILSFDKFYRKFGLALK